VRRRLEAHPGAAPATAGAEVFTPDEQRRLELQRRHRFRAAECGRDPEYPGNRQTADLHLRQLICKALQAAAWDVPEAAALLSRGGSDDLRSRAEARIDTFLANLERRLGMPHGDQLPDEAQRQALLEEWRGNAEALAPVLDALHSGLLQGRTATDGDLDER
jgi:hypothetical protein